MIHPNWTSDPLVTLAGDLAAGQDHRDRDDSVREGLCQLYAIVTTLEDRFPGISFRELLADHDEAPQADRAEFRERLQRAGVTPENIRLAIPNIKQLKADGVPRRDFQYAS